MERLKKFIHRKFDGYNRDEYIIMFVFCTIFLPFYISLITIAGILGYLIIKKRLISIVNEVPRAKFAIAFCIITTLVAFFSGNILGGFCGIGILMILLFTFFYRTIISKRLFELLLDACCIISLFCVAWALMEYYRIISRLDYSFLLFKVEDSPKNRINSTFFNANYYAMMIEFIVLICVYKMMQAKSLRRVVFYVVTILCNLFVLYLTGCRTAWAPFFVTIPFLFLLNRRFGYFSISMSAIVAGAAAVLINPSLLPRSGAGESFEIRTNIWETAIKGIQAHPFFGQGPLTYFHIYKDYGGHPTQHAHNVLLDPILSHGIITVLIVAVYLGANLKQVIRLFTKRIDVRLFSLIIAFILTVLIHGMLDYTIYWVQTGLTFLIVLSSSSMYFNKRYIERDKDDIAQ